MATLQKQTERARALDPEDAAARAVDVFWEKGFEGASLDDLTDALGISRSALSAAFGDKRGLFLAALGSYSHEIAGKAQDAFMLEPDIRRGVRRFFEVALETACRSDGPKGCLIGQSAVASVATVDGVAETLRAMTLRMRGHLAGRFDRERLAGDLPEDFDSAARAALMIELAQGQAHRARIGDSFDEISDGIALRVAAVLR